MAFVLHLLRSNDHFLVIGANVGTYTILASGVLQGHSFTLEPIPATFAVLQRNLRLNDLNALVDGHCLAVGAEQGSLHFTAGRDTTNRAVSLLPSPHANQTTLEVPVTTVDQLLNGQPAPLLRKVDVERFESEVLRGAVQALRNPELRAVLLEADSPSLQATMIAAGFSRCVYDPITRQLQASSASSPPTTAENQLWIRDLAFVQER